MRWVIFLLGAFALFVTGVACVAAGGVQGSTMQAPEGKGSSPDASPVTRVAGAVVRIGPPETFENLTVFPILASAQVDPGPLRTLSSAMADGSAVVREIGDDSGDAEVESLVIENRGPIPIYVLAGTVVRGGKQDRQIGQDFIVPGKKTMEVDAFCVEQGRWDEDRDGKATGGKFKSAAGLATTKVRAAAQYKGNQKLVWDEVAEVNKSHKKSASTGTLTATLDDAEVRKRASRLAEQATGHLVGGPQRDEVVGLAYAVDGEVRAVRWFAHRNVFSLFRETLVSSAALEALTARGGGPPKPVPNLTPDDVTAFMARIDRGERSEEKKTEGNVNRYQFADEGAASEVLMAPAASPDDGKPAKSPPMPLGKDYTKY